MRFSTQLASAALLSFLPLGAQEAGDAAEETPAPIGPVEPVPLPTDADRLVADDLEPVMPESVDLEIEGGFDGNWREKTAVFRGAIRATGDNGMTLRADGGGVDLEAREWRFEGAVKLTTEDGVEVFADRAVLEDREGTVTLTGDVSIYQGQSLQRGDEVIYHIDRGEFEATGLRTGVDPLLLEAGGFRVENRDGERVYVGENAGVTTHDVSDPGYWVRADETTVYPKDRVVFRDMKLYAGGIPVFWLPYFSQPLDAQLGYHFVPGARSNWGAYLLNTYGIMLGTGEDRWLLSRWQLDLRSRRGLAGGVDLIDRRLEDNPNLTGLSLYYANDLDPTVSRTGLPRPGVNEDRWRFRLQHRATLPFEGGERWRVDSNLTALSDNYFLEDFDPRAFSTDPSPDNTLALFRRDDHSLFGLTTRLRPNDFYRSETRLPEVSFDQSRRPLFGTPVLHEGRTSAALIDERIGSAARADVTALLSLPPGSPLSPTLLNRLPTYERQLVQRLRALPPGSPLAESLRTRLFNPGYARFHTYQELSLPMKLGGWLNLTPEAGVGYSRYDSVHGPTGGLNRTHLYAGAEASVKFSRDFGDYRNRGWGLNGLLHVFQPYARFSFLSTDDLTPLFPSVDRETFTTRPRTLSPNRFDAIDSLRDWSILRLGVRNRLITRRDAQSYGWLYLDTYIDRFFEDPELTRSFSNLYNDLTWSPLPWLDVELETQVPVVDRGSGFSEASARLRFMPNENLEFAIGNRFLNNHPILVDSNRFDVRAYARLNEKWGVGATQIWEMDDGTLELQQYTLHRDFNHFVGSLGFTARDNRIEEEYGVILSIALKDFPSASLPLTLDGQ